MKFKLTRYRQVTSLVQASNETENASENQLEPAESSMVQSSQIWQEIPGPGRAME
jgi:hypothetical protein